MNKQLFGRLFSAILLICLALGSVTPKSVYADKTNPAVTISVDQAVVDEINAAGSASYWVNFNSEVDLSSAYTMDWSSRGWYVYQQLQKNAAKSQARFLKSLDQSKTPYQAFWIKNTVLVEGSGLNLLNSMQAFPEVESITARKKYFLYDAETSIESPQIGLNAIEPNLTHINADDAWAKGINGSGLVVANIDTGVRYLHQALVSQYRGNNGGTFDHNYNWFNPGALTDNVPRDGHGHGTHTMGIMVGNDGGANQVGIAPGAKWIACAGCPDGNCTDAALLACGQWIAAPTDLTGANPNPDMRPNVVNNSWGDCGSTYDPWYEGTIAAWQAAGIYPIFSVGNSGNCGYSSPPGLNTAGNPARAGDVTSVGSSGQQNGQYASHSNWGPTDNLDTINPTNGFAALKPQVIAPGVSIRSAINISNNSYGLMSGTSMSAPHVAGLVALIWQAAPCLVGNYAVTENIIESSAVDITYEDGSPATPTNFPNYATGWGEIDVLAAVTQAEGICPKGTLSGIVTEDGSIPVGGAEVLAEHPLYADRRAFSQSDGTYSMDLSEGIYNLTTTKYGYAPATSVGVVVTGGLTTMQNFVLPRLTTSLVSGYVRDGGLPLAGMHGYPLYARVEISAPGFSTIMYTDPFSGYYEVELFNLVDYKFSVNAVAPGYKTINEIVTPNEVAYSKDFSLMVGSACAAPGYNAQGVSESFEQGTLPTGWVNHDYLGTGQVWQFNDPGGRGNLTPGGDGGFAILDSDNFDTSGHQIAGLRTPVMNFSGVPSVNLEFDTDYKFFSGDSGTVRVSNDNAATWIDVWVKNADFNGHVNLDITAQAAGYSQVIVEFKYIGDFAWWWQIDDVQISPFSCRLPSGGVVAGFVYSTSTGLPLVGAQVSSANVTTLTFELADDPSRKGLYWVFQPFLTNTQAVEFQLIDFTAAMANIGSVTKSVAVKENSVTRQDFYLGEVIFMPLIFK